MLDANVKRFEKICPRRAEMISSYSDGLSFSIREHLLECQSCSQWLRVHEATTTLIGPEKEIVLLEQLLEKFFQKPARDEESAPREPVSSVAVGITKIDKYDIDAVLGRGAYGTVYRGFDPDLQRYVAIKVPRFNERTAQVFSARFLAEARTAASLNHPNLIPVYQFGTFDADAVFLVMEYIDGDPLSQKAKKHFSIESTIDLFCGIAEGLHYIHEKGLVHRDVKPANLMITHDNVAKLGDFGLAILDRERVFQQGIRAGSPGYMAPEQVRGETHRLGPPTDIWGMGVCLYEFLTGRPPFLGQTLDDTFDEILNVDARDMRRFESSIDAELERICFKCISKRMSDRYVSSQEFIDDLQAFLRSRTNQPTRHDRHMPAVRWKGLLNYDEDDADFFLSLLQGPRERNGVPESLRFWMDGIESNDSTRTFQVGNLFGPSGIGKTSFVKAGLIPLLSDRVSVISIDAKNTLVTNELISSVAGQLPFDSSDVQLDLPAQLHAFRQLLSETSQKSLIVIDHFEYWLESWNGEPNDPLVRAIRHCDGKWLQALLVIRDDQWLAASHFMQKIEVHQLHGQNVGILEGHTLPHASGLIQRIVDAMDAGPLTGTQRKSDFADAIASAIEEKGRVAPLAIAMAVERLHQQPWEKAEQIPFRNTQQLRVEYIESRLNDLDSDPQLEKTWPHVQQVLRSFGEDQQSVYSFDVAELTNLCGSQQMAEEVIDVLVHRTKLYATSGQRNSDSETRYTLTHETLATAIRDWINNRKARSWKGAAQVILQERTNAWKSNPMRRQLPTVSEYVLINASLRRRQLPSDASRMLQAADRKILTYCLIALLMLSVFTVGIQQAVTYFRWHNTAQAFDALMLANIENVSSVLDRIRPMVRNHETIHASLKQRHLTPHERLRLFAAYDQRFPELTNGDFDILLSTDCRHILYLKSYLTSYLFKVEPQLWKILESNSAKEHQRLRAACWLTAIDKNHTQWDELMPIIATTLIEENSSNMIAAIDAFEPLSTKLGSELHRRLKESSNERVRSKLVDALTHLHEKEPLALLNIAGSIRDKELQTITKAFQPYTNWLSEQLSDSKLPHPQNELARLIGLSLELDHEAIWDAFAHSSSPSTRTRLIHRLPFQSKIPDVLIQRLRIESDPGAIYAILLAIGGFEISRLNDHQRTTLESWLFEHYSLTLDSGVHAAIGWLLQKMGHEKQLESINQQLAQIGIRDRFDWYHRANGQLMIVIRTPEKFLNTLDEEHRTTEIRPFAIAANETTVEEFTQHLPNHVYDHNLSTTIDSPILNVSVGDALEFCQILDDRSVSIEREDESFRAHVQLDRPGLRLPTEWEWEIACRAGTATSRFFGNDEEIQFIHNYACLDVNSPLRPAGTGMPNPLGLFNIYGNAHEWTISHHALSSPTIENSFTVAIDENDLLIIRGGFRDTPLAKITSGNRQFHLLASSAYRRYGFRIAHSLK